MGLASGTYITKYHYDICLVGRYTNVPGEEAGPPSSVPRRRLNQQNVWDIAKDFPLEATFSVTASVEFLRVF